MCLPFVRDGSEVTGVFIKAFCVLFEIVLLKALAVGISVEEI